MTKLRAQLHEADPLHSEPALTDSEVRHMRRTVLAATSPERRQRGFTREQRWKVVAAAVAVAAGVSAMHWIINRPLSSAIGASANPPMRAADLVEQQISRRQVQFVTAGGTRVIWTLTQEF